MSVIDDVAELDRKRYAAVKQRLSIRTFFKVKDLDLARAWRDLGFPLKFFMREILEQASEPLTPQGEPAPPSSAPQISAADFGRYGSKGDIQ